jgi:hypothetical protein
VLSLQSGHREIIKRAASWSLWLLHRQWELYPRRIGSETATPSAPNANITKGFHRYGTIMVDTTAKLEASLGA